jgi:hypothetical protein
LSEFTAFASEGTIFASQAAVSERRFSPRFTISPGSEGELRVSRQVLVEVVKAHEIVAISRKAGVIGERVSVEIMGQEGDLISDARIVESRPAVFAGIVCHRLRLVRIDARPNGTPGVEG